MIQPLLLSIRPTRSRVLRHPLYLLPALLLWSLLLTLSNILAAQNFNEVIKAVASDRAASDYFGRAVAIDGNYAIIGAYAEDEDANGGGTFELAGSAYIFERDATGNWVEVQKLVASDRSPEDYFGRSVSISGSYAIVGAYREDEDSSGGNRAFDAGSAYIFERDATGNWVEIQKIVASDRVANDQFAYSVSISGDYLIVGARYEGDDETFYATGSAYIFERNAMGSWIEVKKVIPFDQIIDGNFGHSVSISGTYAIAGDYRNDVGGGNATDDAGAAYIFERDALGNWVSGQKLVASDLAAYDLFGWSVSISGDYVIVGAYGEDENADGMNRFADAGSAYIFERGAMGNWLEVQKLVASDRAPDDFFGYSVSISGGYAIAGAYLEDDDMATGRPPSGPGAAYVFERYATGDWAEINRLVASDRITGRAFGRSVSISGTYAIVGAPSDYNDAAGGNPITLAGAAYIFESNTSLPVEWLSFSANAGVKQVDLQWKTSHEPDNAGFHIERSPDGQDWAVIGEQAPLIRNVYGHTDKAPLAGDNYYRIRQTDFDGTATYSPVEVVIFTGELTAISVIPNPVTDAFTVILPSAFGKKPGLNLFDATGRMIQLHSNGTSFGIRVEAENLAPGVYLLRATSHDGKLTQTIRVMRR